MEMVDMVITNFGFLVQNREVSTFLSASKSWMIFDVGFFDFEKMTFLEIFDMYWMIFDINSQYLAGFKDYGGDKNSDDIIYTRYSSHTPPPQCPTPSPQPHMGGGAVRGGGARGVGGVGWGIGVVGYAKNIVYIWYHLIFFPHRNPVPKQREKLNGHHHLK